MVAVWAETDLILADEFRHGDVPARVASGLEKHQRLSPELAARIVHPVTESGSYERAAAMCAVWGSPVSDGAIRQLTRKPGRRMSPLPLPAEKPMAGEGPFSLMIMMDGVVWLWDLAEDRFKDAIKTLDFHHARAHRQAVADLEHGVGTEANRDWMKRTTGDLAGGRPIRVLSQLEGLLSSPRQRTAQEREDLEREVAYFRSHRDPLHYREREREGSPRGSGAIESLGKQLQARLRGCGQFWGQPGLPPLLRLCVAVKNKDAHLLGN